MRSLAAYLAVALASFEPVAQAQYYDPSWAQGQANIFINSEINRTMIESLPRAGTGGGATVRPAPIQARVEKAAIEALRSGLQRRWAAAGEQQAKAWYVGAARAVGGEMGRLVPEYNRRVARDGVALADRWYTDQATRAGERLGR